MGLILPILLVYKLRYRSTLTLPLIGSNSKAIATAYTILVVEAKNVFIPVTRIAQLKRIKLGKLGRYELHSYQCSIGPTVDASLNASTFQQIFNP